MSGESPTPGELLERLLGHFQARAVGWWRVNDTNSSLDQRGFCAVSEMPEETAREFETMTRAVPLSRVNLGIVKAAVTGQVAVSRALELPPDDGSGLWLRRFGAERSVAVPIEDSRGIVVEVISIALGTEPTDALVAATLRRVAIEGVIS